MRMARKRHNSHGKGIVDQLGSQLLSVAQKRDLLLNSGMSGEEREIAIHRLRGIAENWDKEDCARIEAVRVLKAMDAETAAALSLELAGNKSNSILLRCNAIAFFVKNSKSCTKEIIDKAMSILCKIASDEKETKEIRMQAVDAYEII